MALGELVFLSIIYDWNDTPTGREVRMGAKSFQNTLSILLIRTVLAKVATIIISWVST